MKKTYSGYAVEIAKQILISGTWEDEYPNWKWETEWHYFFYEDDAERYLDKIAITNDTPIVKMYSCNLEMTGCRLDEVTDLEFIQEKS